MVVNTDSAHKATERDGMMMIDPCRDDMSFSSHDLLVVLLEDWAAWVRSYRMNIGWRSRSVGMESGYCSKDFDSMLSDVEDELFRKVDAAINDLPPAQCAAINRCYGICAVFRFPRMNYQQLLLEAHESLLVSVSKKGIAL